MTLETYKAKYTLPLLEMLLNTPLFSSNAYLVLIRSKFLIEIRFPYLFKILIPFKHFKKYSQRRLIISLFQSKFLPHEPLYDPIRSY